MEDTLQRFRDGNFPIDVPRPRLGFRVVQSGRMGLEFRSFDLGRWASVQGLVVKDLGLRVRDLRSGVFWA